MHEPVLTAVNVVPDTVQTVEGLAANPTVKPDDAVADRLAVFPAVGAVGAVNVIVWASPLTEKLEVVPEIQTVG